MKCRECGGDLGAFGLGHDFECPHEVARRALELRAETEAERHRELLEIADREAESRAAEESRWEQREAAREARQQQREALEQARLARARGAARILSELETRLAETEDAAGEDRFVSLLEIRASGAALDPACLGSGDRRALVQIRASVEKALRAMRNELGARAEPLERMFERERMRAELENDVDWQGGPSSSVTATPAAALPRVMALVDEARTRLRTLPKGAWWGGSPFLETRAESAPVEAGRIAAARDRLDALLASGRVDDVASFRREVEALSTSRSKAAELGEEPNAGRLAGSLRALAQLALFGTVGALCVAWFYRFNERQRVGEWLDHAKVAAVAFVALFILHKVAEARARVAHERWRILEEEREMAKATAAADSVILGAAVFLERQMLDAFIKDAELRVDRIRQLLALEERTPASPITVDQRTTARVRDAAAQAARVAATLASSGVDHPSANNT